jgi:predicted  nucleic acid-binding Zn-ribbon protein
MSNQPDDVSLDQVRKEYKALQLERENPTLFRLLSEIKSSLTKVDDRIEDLEVDVRKLRDDVSKLEHKLDGKLEDLKLELLKQISPVSPSHS